MGMDSLIIFFAYVIIISLLLVVRGYQKTNKKLISLLMKLLIEGYHVNNTMTEKLSLNELEDMDKKYKILLKMLDNIKLEKSEEKEKLDEEIS